MKTGVYGRYHTETPIEALGAYMYFWLDCMNEDCYVGCSYLEYLGYDDEIDKHLYATTCHWAPNATGQHVLIGEVLIVNDLRDLGPAKNGTGIVASGEVLLSIMSCPSNAVFHVPEASYGECLPVTAAFSKPRIYEKKNMTGFAAYSLSEKLNYDGLTYAIDAPANSTMVDLYVDDVWDSRGYTDADGIACLDPHMDYPDSHFNVTLEAQADGAYLYQGKSVTRELSLTRASVREVSVGGTSLFSLNYTLKSDDQADEAVYVLNSKAIEVDVSMYDVPLFRAPVSFVVGKPISRGFSADDGYVRTATGTSLMRVTNIYNLTTTTAADPRCDVIKDGKIDLKDYYMVGQNFGKELTASNWRADLNMDLIDRSIRRLNCTSYLELGWLRMEMLLLLSRRRLES